MRTLSSLIALTLIAPILRADEYVSREHSGQHGQHVAETTYHFEGSDCYGAKRAYWNQRRQVPRPKIYWDLFYEGNLIATLDPDEWTTIYLKAPEGMLVHKHLSRISLSKEGELLRVWILDANGLKLLPSEELERLSQAQKTPHGPQYGRLMTNFPVQERAPTLEQAQGMAQKSK
ncbi:MAG: hypothetical protein R3242_01505 [Akkermansiaceae bacterium]|nr:hypothetical protein [Akkermansiaceae bacterium]